MIGAILRIVAALLDLLPKAIEATRAWQAGRDQAGKDARNDAAIAAALKEANKATRPKE